MSLRIGSFAAAAAFGLLVLGTAGAAVAQDEGDAPICANRPGKGTPTCTVAPGRWQVELGLYDVVSDHEGGVSTNVYNAADLQARLGLTQSLEVQVAITPYVLVKQRDGATGARFTQSGASDVTVSLRQALIRTGGFSVSVQPFVTAPTGASGISADKWLGGVILPMSFSLTPSTGLFLSPEVDWSPNLSGSGYHAAYSGVVGVSHSLGQFTLGAEVWAGYDDDPSGSLTAVTGDLTAAWIPRWMPSLQFDAGVNAGLNKAAPDLEVYAGISKRF